ncbi:hypothetical protein [Lysinibacillus xylanilyticus]|uniref:hypothetical protein n=1 Tax=Lysinibacillus xylanilyticus TaxID=582475 RepID=UPI003CFFC251
MGVQTPVPVATLSVQIIAEIEELSLRTPRPVAIYETSYWPKASGGCHGIGKEFLGDVSRYRIHAITAN